MAADRKTDEGPYGPGTRRDTDMAREDHPRPWRVRLAAYGEADIYDADDSAVGLSLDLGMAELIVQAVNAYEGP